METFHVYGLNLETDTTSLSNILLANAVTESAQIQGKGTQVPPGPRSNSHWEKCQGVVAICNPLLYMYICKISLTVEDKEVPITLHRYFLESYHLVWAILPVIVY